MAIGPVQLIVLGFNHPNFHGEVIDELERLRDSDTIRVIDALAVHKDADGEIEVAHLRRSRLAARSPPSSGWVSRVRKEWKPAPPPAPRQQPTA